MRCGSAIVLCGALLGSAVQCVFSAGAPVNVVVTLRGKKYDVSASSVAELQAELQEKAGLNKDQQSVLFKGKLLSASDELGSAGVSEGDTINVVPAKRKGSAVASAGSASGTLPNSDKGALSGFPGMGGLGGMPGMPEGMPDLSPEEYQKMMGDVLNSPMMDEFFGSPEKIEESRKAILENPMLKQAMSQLPGFSDMLEDPEKWQESMLQAKEMMEAQRQQMQEGGSPFGGAGAFGAFGGADVDDLDDE